MREMEGNFVEDREAQKEMRSCGGSCKNLTLFSFPFGPLAVVVCGPRHHLQVSGGRRSLSFLRKRNLNLLCVCVFRP